MQITRLFEIVYILLEKRSVTAAELAERFEVSARTIYRDLETLSGAGIPIYAARGKGGGIRIMENFVLNKSLLSASEQSEILAALHGLSLTQAGGSALLKLGALFDKRAANWIEIDFSDWGQSDREAFAELKRAILENRLVTFDYYSSMGEMTRRTAEPLMLWFKHRGWYLRAFCLDKMDERLFKLSRVKRLRVLDDTFIPRQGGTGRDVPAGRVAQAVTVRLRIAEEMLFRVYDEFDESMIERMDDGSYLCEATFPEDEWVYGYILSFGHCAEVLEPSHVRENIKMRLKKHLAIYRD